MVSLNLRFRIFKCDDIKNTTLTHDKELNSLIYTLYFKKNGPLNLFIIIL